MTTQRRGLLKAAAATTLLGALPAALAQSRIFFGIATGGTGGTYYPLGGMLAQLISNKVVIGGRSNRPSSPPTSSTPPSTARTSSTPSR